MQQATSAATSTEEKGDAIWEQRCGVLYKAWVQVRYHRRRQRFFDLADKLTKALTLVLGGSLFGQYLPSLPWVATALTTAGLMALVFGYSDRKQQHKELAERASDIVAEIERIPSSQLTDINTANWNAEYARLCARAPAPLKTLTLICEHEQSCADGHSEHVRMPKRWRCLLADFKN